MRRSGNKENRRLRMMRKRPPGVSERVRIGEPRICPAEVFVFRAHDVQHRNIVGDMRLVGDDVVVVFRGPGKENAAGFPAAFGSREARGGNAPFARTRHGIAAREAGRFIKVPGGIVEFLRAHRMDALVVFARDGRRIGNAVGKHEGIGCEEGPAEARDEAGKGAFRGAPMPELPCAKRRIGAAGRFSGASESLPSKAPRAAANQAFSKEAMSESAVCLSAVPDILPVRAIVMRDPRE